MESFRARRRSCPASSVPGTISSSCKASSEARWIACLLLLPCCFSTSLRHRLACETHLLHWEYWEALDWVVICESILLHWLVLETVPSRGWECDHHWRSRGATATCHGRLASSQECGAFWRHGRGWKNRVSSGCTDVEKGGHCEDLKAQEPSLAWRDHCWHQLSKLWGRSVAKLQMSGCPSHQWVPSRPWRLHRSPPWQPSSWRERPQPPRRPVRGPSSRRHSPRADAPPEMGSQHPVLP